MSRLHSQTTAPITCHRILRLLTASESAGVDFSQVAAALRTTWHAMYWIRDYIFAGRWLLSYLYNNVHGPVLARDFHMMYMTKDTDSVRLSHGREKECFRKSLHPLRSAIFPLHISTCNPITPVKQSSCGRSLREKSYSSPGFSIPPQARSIRSYMHQAA